MRPTSAATAVALALALVVSFAGRAATARAQDAGAVASPDAGAPALDVTIAPEPAEAVAPGVALDAAEPAAGAEPAPPTAAAAATPPASVRAAPGRTTERVAPDYDGRAEPGTTAGEVLLWIPRVIFAPLYLVTEFVLRRPIGWLISSAERANLPGLLLDFFTFDERRSAGFAPTALIDFGFKPSVGLYVFWDDVGFAGHDLRFRFATWGFDWLTLALADRMRISEHSRMAVKAAFSRRPDWRFYGLGPSQPPENLSRYASQSLDIGLSFEAEPWRSSSARWYAGWRDVAFESETCCGDPAIGEQVANMRFELPPGFTDGYSIWLQRMTLAFDTREFAGSGVRVELRGEQAFDVDAPARRRWIKWGGVVGAFLDLTGHRRVVGLSLAALFADPLPGSESIPFTEQVALGGDDLMRGFLAGRLYDRSAIAATFEYRWPVWIWLDGSLQVSVGNVLPEHLRGFSMDLMRLSATLGFRTSSRADHSFDLLFGIGTEPFGNGFEVSSFRFVVGTKDGF